MFAKTSQVPWHIVEAHDRRFATVKVFATMVETLDRAVKAAASRARRSTKRSATQRLAVMQGSVLDTVDLDRTLERAAYERQLKKYQKRVAELEHEVYLERVPVIIVYEGWDAAGKGGNIRRLVQGLDPRGYEVVPIAAPNVVEKAHHYLHRFWLRVPKAGHITIFDRSWYGRVLVERVEGFCTEEEWKRAYAEINETEEQWCDFGAAVVKFWLHIDQDEQLRRFEARQRTAYKRWKITDEDWRNREKWNQYQAAVDEMLYRTSTTHAPWTIVEATNKLYARIRVLRTVVDTLEKRLSHKP
jgi:polyphosphate kinase 2 (PPK2 family)